jgi:hypothetical protein
MNKYTLFFSCLIGLLMWVGIIQTLRYLIL